MCRLFATKDFSQAWRASREVGSVEAPKDTSAPLLGWVSKWEVGADLGWDGELAGGLTRRSSVPCLSKQ
jgi:hypothetical protein